MSLDEDFCSTSTHTASVLCKTTLRTEKLNNKSLHLGIKPNLCSHVSMSLLCTFYMFPMWDHFVVFFLVLFRSTTAHFFCQLADSRFIIPFLGLDPKAQRVMEMKSEACRYSLCTLYSSLENLMRFTPNNTEIKRQKHDLLLTVRWGPNVEVGVVKYQV